MLIKGTEDLRIQKTMAAIKESFEALICEKDYNDIKVTELCARAKINKKTLQNRFLSNEIRKSDHCGKEKNRICCH